MSGVLWGVCPLGVGSPRVRRGRLVGAVVGAVVGVGGGWSS